MANCFYTLIFGALAQLGARMTGSHEVRGSIPLCSTTRQASVRMLVFYVINRGSEPERHIHQPSYLPPENYVLRLAIHKLMMVLGGGDMATKTATVMARVAPDVKSLAESIMEQLGIPASNPFVSTARQCGIEHTNTLV